MILSVIVITNSRCASLTCNCFNKTSLLLIDKKVHNNQPITQQVFLQKLSFSCKNLVWCYGIGIAIATKFIGIIANESFYSNGVFSSSFNNRV